MPGVVIYGGIVEHSPLSISRPDHDTFLVGIMYSSQVA